MQFRRSPRGVASSARSGRRRSAASRSSARLLQDNVVNHWFENVAAEAGVRRISSLGTRQTKGERSRSWTSGIGVALGQRDLKATERGPHVAASCIALRAEAHHMLPEARP